MSITELFDKIHDIEARYFLKHYSMAGFNDVRDKVISELEKWVAEQNPSANMGSPVAGSRESVGLQDGGWEKKICWKAHMCAVRPGGCKCPKNVICPI